MTTGRVIGVGLAGYGLAGRVFHGPLVAHTGGVQVVVVGTPHDTHEAMMVEAVRAGKHVVVDKIMCLTVAEGERMIAAAREAGVVFSVFHNRRWDSDYLTVK